MPAFEVNGEVSEASQVPARTGEDERAHRGRMDQMGGGRGRGGEREWEGEGRGRGNSF